jgi:hypothetical protein
VKNGHPRLCIGFPMWNGEERREIRENCVKGGVEL